MNKFMQATTQRPMSLLLVRICYSVFLPGENIYIYRICSIFQGSYISQITCLEGFARLNFC